MIRKLLKTARRAALINVPVRTFIKAGSYLFDRLRQRWPVSGTMSVKYEDVNFKVYNKCDDGFVNFFYYETGYHESNVLTITDAFAKKSDLILDIGANTGIDSIIIAKKNPALKIIAIEPFKPNYERLEKNISLNSVENIEVRKIALGDSVSEINFFVPSDGRITDVSSAVEGLGEKVYGDEIKWEKAIVKQTTLDELHREIGPVKFFKCDVESYELNVFKGAEVFFRERRPSFILEICFSDEKVAYFNEFARRFNYTIYFLGEEGLIKLDELYIFDWRGDFLFTQFNARHNFIPSKDLTQFVNDIR